MQSVASGIRRLEQLVHLSLHPPFDVTERNLNIAHLALACCMTLAGTPGLIAQDLAVEVAHVGDLPASRISCIEESGDGRIWFGGLGGLWFDDGHGIQELNLPSAIGMRQRVLCMTPAADGGLIVGLTTGLYRVPAHKTAIVPAITPPAPHTMWALSDGTGGGWLRTMHLTGKQVARIDEGLWQGWKPQGLVRWDAQGIQESVLLPNGDQATSLAFGSGHRWVWDAGSLWHGLGADGPLTHLANLKILGGIADGDGMVFWSDTDVGRITADGLKTIMCEGICAREVVREEHGYWVRGFKELHWIPRAGGPSQQVYLFRERTAANDLIIQTIHSNGRGSVWIGQELGASQFSIWPEIANVRVPLIDLDARVTAIAEAPDGAIWLGSSTGQLLRHAKDQLEGWIPVPVPAGQDKPISSIVFDAQGRLCVAHWRFGVWRLEDGKDWERLNPLGTVGARQMVVHGGELFGCSNHEVWRERASGDFEKVTLQGLQENGSTAVPRSFSSSAAGLFLATYRGGLYRLDESTGQFTHLALTDSVLSVVGMKDKVFAATKSDIWQVKANGEVSHAAIVTHDWFRSMCGADNDVLWIAQSNMLQTLEDGAMRRLRWDSGAHPLGYSFLAQARCADGGVLLGARGGYTRLQPSASASATELSRARAWIIDSTKPSVRIPLEVDSTIDLQGSSFRVEAEVFDQGRHSRIGCQAIVESEDTGLMLLGQRGTFQAQSGGSYRVKVEYRERTGIPRTVEIGRIKVTHPTAGWVYALATVPACLGFLVWRLRRRKPPTLSKTRAAADLAAVLGGDSDEVLDIAFLVVAAVESAAHRTGVVGGGVWLTSSDKPRFLVADFGGNPTADATWLEQGVQEGQTTRPSIMIREVEGAHDLVILLDADAAVKFCAVVRQTTPWTRQALDEVDRELEPARRALSRYIWLSRLQSYCVRSGMSLEADLHDLRGPLTALRFGIGELQEHHGQLAPTIQGLSQATERLIKAVDRLQAPSIIERTEADVGELVTEVTNNLKPRATERTIDLRITTPEAGSCPASVDEVWFRRAIQNVVGNALKYCNPASTVNVTVRQAEDDVLVVVEDEGPGICPEDRDYVFLPGGLGNNSPRNGEEQTGIGLWVSRQAIRAMGGRMWITAGTSGGTCVHLSLPMAKEQAAT